MFSSRGMDKFVIECLENSECLNSDSDSDDNGKNKSKNRQGDTRRKQRLKALVWEFVFYAVYMMLLISTAFDNRDERSYGFHSSIVAAADPNGTINQMSTPGEMFKWIRNQLVPFLYATKEWDNSSVQSDNIRATTSLASYRLGPTRIRQHRSPREPCISLTNQFPLEIRCIPSWSSGYRDWADYGPEWTILGPNASTSDMSKSPWKYSRWADVGGTPVAGRLGMYPNGGYVQDLTGTLEDVNVSLTELQRLRWVDQWTKVVLIETTIYCPNINMFAMITALFEFPQAMTIHAQLYTHPFKLINYLNDYPLSARIFDFLIFFAVLWFVIRMVFKMCKWKRSFFTKFWNLMELANLFLAVAVIVLYLGRQVVAEHVAKEASKTRGQFYNFQTLAMWDQLFGILLGFCCCLSTLKILHLARFNRRLSLLGATMKRAAKELAGFAFMYGLIMAGFVSFSFIMYGCWLYTYSTIMGTIQSLLLLALGDLQYEEITSVNRVFAPVLISVYMAVIIFILLNVLISILMDSFAIAREAIKGQANDLELLNVMAKSVWVVVTTPLLQVWDLACKSGLVSSTKSDKGPGTAARVVSSMTARQSIQHSSKDPEKFHAVPPSSNKNRRLSHGVKFSPSSAIDCPTRPTGYFTPRAERNLTRVSFVDFTPGSAKAIRKRLCRKLSTSVNFVEDSSHALHHQLNLIDQRLDRLWELFVGIESGPPPELTAICRWREVKITVADVVAEHLGSHHGMSADSDQEEEIERTIILDDSDLSVSSDESFIESDDGGQRRLSQEGETKRYPVVCSDLTVGDTGISDDRDVRFSEDVDEIRKVKEFRLRQSEVDNIITVILEPHVRPSYSEVSAEEDHEGKRRYVPEQIMPLSMNNLFSANDGDVHEDFDDDVFGQQEFAVHPLEPVAYKEVYSDYLGDRSKPPESVLNMGDEADVNNNDVIHGMQESMLDIMDSGNLDEDDDGEETHDQVVPSNDFEKIGHNFKVDDNKDNFVVKQPKEMNEGDGNREISDEIVIRDDDGSHGLRLDWNGTQIDIELSLVNGQFNSNDEIQQPTTIDEIEVPDKHKQPVRDKKDGTENYVTPVETLNEPVDLPFESTILYDVTLDEPQVGIVEAEFQRYNKTQEYNPKPEFQMVDETKSSFKPFSPIAAMNINKREPKYQQRKHLKFNFDSPVATMIKRAHDKKEDEEINSAQSRRASNPLEKLVMHYRQGERPASWPEARSSGADQLDLLIESGSSQSPSASSPASEPSVVPFRLADVLNDTGYHSTGDLHTAIEEFSPRQPWVPNLKVSVSALDPELAQGSDNTSMSFDTSMSLLMVTPERAISNLRRPRVDIVDERCTTPTPSGFSTPKLSSSSNPRRLSSLSVKSPLFHNEPFDRRSFNLTPTRNSRKTDAFAMGALAAAPQLSKRRPQTKRAMINESLTDC